MKTLAELEEQLKNGEAFLKHMGWDEESQRAKSPDWYGIPGVKFIWRGWYSDPEIEYKRKRCSCYIVEDTMWERFREETNSEDEEMFDKYMLDNKDEVYELCELALGLEE